LAAGGTLDIYQEMINTKSFKTLLKVIFAGPEHVEDQEHHGLTISDNGQF
jgi:hypothetical protein